MRWSVAEAKQKFSEVLRATTDEPQLIFNRERMVAVLVDPGEYDAFRSWKDKQGQSIWEATAEIRRIAGEEGWELEVPARTNRPNAFDEMLDELESEPDK